MATARKWPWILAALAGTIFVGAVATVVVVWFFGRGERIELKPAIYPNGLQGTTLIINGINHGLGLEKPTNPLDIGNPGKDFSRLPTTYYHRLGPAGIVLERFNWWGAHSGANLSDVRQLNMYRADARMPASLISAAAPPMGSAHLPVSALVAIWSEPPLGVIDLGTGTLASYARPLQTLDFYESNEAIKELSLPKGPQAPVFPFVKDAMGRGANIRVFLGPERKTLADKGPEKFYHALFVETSHGHPDYPASERLTTEAMQLFFDKVVDEGVVCYHVSNRNYDLHKVVVDVAGQLGFASVHGNDTTMKRPAPVGDLFFSSEWVVVARNPQYLRHLTPPPNPAGGPVGVPFWSNPPASGQHVWTDQAQNLGSVGRR
jgi:hypothetical protein